MNHCVRDCFFIVCADLAGWASLYCKARYQGDDDRRVVTIHLCTSPGLVSSVRVFYSKKKNQTSNRSERIHLSEITALLAGEHGVVVPDHGLHQLGRRVCVRAAARLVDKVCRHGLAQGHRVGRVRDVLRVSAGQHGLYKVATYTGSYICSYTGQRRHTISDNTVMGPGETSETGGGAVSLEQEPHRVSTRRSSFPGAIVWRKTGEPSLPRHVTIKIYSSLKT